MLTHQGDFLRFSIQAASRGFFPVYLGSDGWGSSEHVYEKLVARSLSKDRFLAYRSSAWKADVDTSLSQAFKNMYKIKYGINPASPSAVSFDSAWILFTAMNQAENPNSGESIRQEMKKLKNIPLVTVQNFTFGTDNTVKRDLHIDKIDNKGCSYEGTLR